MAAKVSIKVCIIILNNQTLIHFLFHTYEYDRAKQTRAKQMKIQSIIIANYFRKYDFIQIKLYTFAVGII